MRQKASTHCWLFVACCLWSCCKGYGIAEEVTIDLRKGDSLLWIYESGLRPRHGANNRNGCEVIHQRVRIVLPNGNEIATEAAWMHISVLRDGKISGITIDRAGELSRNEAQKFVEHYTKLLGPPEEDFEKFADETIANRRGFIRGIFGRGKFKNLDVGWKLLPSMFSSTPFRVRLTVLWERPNNELNWGHTPLEPPSGYEQFPMERDSFSLPTFRPDVKPTQVPIIKSTSKTTDSTVSPPIAVVAQAGESSPVRGGWALWAGIAAVLAAATGWLLLRGRGKKA